MEMEEQCKLQIQQLHSNHEEQVRDLNNQITHYQELLLQNKLINNKLNNELINHHHNYQEMLTQFQNNDSQNQTQIHVLKL